MKVVIKGWLILTDVTTGEVKLAKEHDMLFFPGRNNSEVSDPDYTLGLVAGHRSFAP